MHETRFRQIDRVFFINLAHRTDRCEQVQKTLDQIGCPRALIERFDAVRNDSGIIGCGKSHLGCLNTAREKEYNSILIVEDDCTFYPGTEWSKIESLWCNLPRLIGRESRSKASSAPILLLSSNCQNLKTVSGNSVLDPIGHLRVEQVEESQTSAAYVIDKCYYETLRNNIEEGLKRLIETGHWWDFGFDQFWKRLQKTDEWYITNPILAYQRSSWSDCGNYFTDYVAQGCFPKPTGE